MIHASASRRMGRNGDALGYHTEGHFTDRHAFHSGISNLRELIWAEQKSKHSHSVAHRMQINATRP